MYVSLPLRAVYDAHCYCRIEQRLLHVNYRAAWQLGGLIPISAVKHHFNVSNSYVMKKLRVVLFPWRHKHWSRRMYRVENGQSEWMPPREDINSPDLYIPRMYHPYTVYIARLYLT